MRVACTGSASMTAVHDHRFPSRVWLLLVAGSFGRLPVVMLPLATYLLVADRNGPAAGGLASGALSLTIGLVGLLYGRLVDRRGTRPVFLATAAAMVPAVAALLAASRAGALVAVVVALAAGGTVAPAGPVVRAALAGFGTDPVSRQRVFALEAMSVEVQWIGGPLLVSAAVAVASARVALVMAGVLGIVGNVAVVALTGASGAARPSSSDDGAPWLDRAVLWVVASFGIVGFGMAAASVAITETARNAGRPALAGVLVAVWGVGSFLGGAAAARSTRLLPGPVLGLCLAALTGLVALGGAHVAALAALLVVAGLPIAPFVMSINTVAVGVTTPAAQVRVFAAMAAAATVASALGSPVGAWVADVGRPSFVFPVAAVALALAAIVVVLASRSARLEVAADPAGAFVDN